MSPWCARVMVGTAAVAAAVSSAWAGPGCTLPDNGSGSADLPPVGCAYETPDDDMSIIDGLPPASPIRIDARLASFVVDAAGTGCSFLGGRAPGGSLGGEKVCSDAVLQMPMVGVGMMAGFNRFIAVPVSFETHYGPRTLGAPTQSFPGDVVRLFGQVTGDPDFDLLRITAGTDFGMPSPGHTTLTNVGGGNWAVDSFFDITYRIDFVGHPGSMLGGMSGSTTGTVRFQLPNPPGACCNLATGACTVVSAGSCAALGGQFRGGGTVCAGVTCVPEGACCLGLICRALTAPACAGAGGVFLGNGTTCACAGVVNPCCPADFNNSGAIGVQDIFDFLAAYFAGCP